MNQKSDPKHKTDDEGPHAVAVVGWDDNFNDFNTATSPPYAGAFRVKNSWGTEDADGSIDGYMWISYYDVNLSEAICIKEMKETSPNIPSAVYTNSYFGAGTMYPTVPGEARSVFSDTFKTEDNNESITAIGLLTMTPCVATVELTVSGSQKVTLLKDVFLSYSGFHRIEVAEYALGAEDTEFKIEVTYVGGVTSGTYIPIEKKTAGHNDNLDLENVSGSIMINGVMTKIKDYNLSQQNIKYGNLPIYISVKGGSRTAQDISLAYDSLELPELTADGLLNRLPPRITPSAASASVPVEWRLEPYKRQIYDTSYKPKIKTYQMDYDFGMINTSDSACDAIITAIIGTGKYALKKRFQVSLPPKKQSYSFTVSPVTNGNEVDLSGTLSNVDGATVNIKCNNVSKSVKTDQNGNWSISSFALYDPCKDGGWKDDYKNSTITVSITDDNGFELIQGKQNVTLKRPFEISEDTKKLILNVEMGVASAALAFIAAVEYARYNEEFRWIENAGFPYFPLDEAVGSFMGESIFAETGDISFLLGGTAFVLTSIPLFAAVGNVEGLNIKITDNFTASDSAVPDKFAGIALKMAKGSTIKDCTVEGTISGVKSSGGLFFEGEDVTVENCSVKISSASCTGDFGGVAHTLTGASSVKDCNVDIGKVSGANVAGVAVNLTGTVSNCCVSVSSSATGMSGGVCCNAEDAVISDVLVVNNSTIQNPSESSSIAGIAAAMTGNSSIAHCLMTGKIDGGEVGTAYGIAPGLPDNVQAVTQCVCVPAFITGKNAYRILREASSGCVAYDGIVNAAGGFISSGETLKDPSGILSKDIFEASGFDMDDVWSFDTKKCIASLKEFDAEPYSYPFPCPYPTANGKYQFAPNSELALYGAASQNATKMTWANLSPANASKSSGDSNYMLESDEFYLQMHLMVTQVGEYTMDVISVLDGHSFGKNITIDIADE